MKIMLVFGVLATAPLPLNVYTGAVHKGSLGLGISGIACGAVQTGIGGIILGSENLTKREKVFSATILGLGVANIGAGVFAIMRRKKPAYSFAPGVVTQDGIQPGISISADF